MNKLNNFCSECGIGHSGVSSCDAANNCETCDGDGKVVPFFTVKDYVSDVEANICQCCQGSGDSSRYREWKLTKEIDELKSKLIEIKTAIDHCFWFDPKFPTHILRSIDGRETSEQELVLWNITRSIKIISNE